MTTPTTSPPALTAEQEATLRRITENLESLSGERRMDTSSLTGFLAGVTLALEDNWSWLPAQTRERARRHFHVSEVSGKIHIQLTSPTS